MNRAINPNRVIKKLNFFLHLLNTYIERNTSIGISAYNALLLNVNTTNASNAHIGASFFLVKNESLFSDKRQKFSPTKSATATEKMLSLVPVKTNITITGKKANITMDRIIQKSLTPFLLRR